MTESPVFTFDGVCRRFADQEVLRGLSFRVEPGEVYALLGRNGSGKTTALRILLGFLSPHRGSTTVLGMDSIDLPPAHRERIGYVAEGQRMYGHWRVRDVIAFEDATRTRFDRAHAEASVTRCGMRRNQFLGLLSRGQRAQLALILAVSSRPDVLVFDDPAMGLDPVMRREFLDTMIEMLGQRGTSVLFSSHILTDVERIADRVGILHGGALIVDARMDDLKGRVQQRFWRPRGAGAPPDSDRILASRRHPDGFELTLRDFDADLEGRLRQDGAQLTAPTVPSLEDLFLALTSNPGRSVLTELPAPAQEVQG